MINLESGGHWYACRDGAPKPKHDATLRDARKELYFPSVTTIDKDEFRNPFLEKWKTEQVLLAAAATFKQPHESDEDYIARVYEASQEKSRVASEFGTKVHDAIEHYPQLPLDTTLAPYVDRFGAWFDAEISGTIHREKIMVDYDIGIAGRCDFIGEGKSKFAGLRIVADWKSQGVKKDKKGRKVPNFYDSWCRQLAAYAVCDAKETKLWPQLPTCVSVVIDSTEPDAPFIKVWTREEILSAYEDFVIAAYRWFKRKQYWPVGPWRIENIAMPK